MKERQDCSVLLTKRCPIVSRDGRVKRHSSVETEVATMKTPSRIVRNLNESVSSKILQAAVRKIKGEKSFIAMR
jgi:hypothetical protein